MHFSRIPIKLIGLVAAVGFFGTSAQSAEIDLTTLTTSNSEIRWNAATYLMNDTVGSLNSITTHFTENLHHQLNLEKASRLHRLGFYMSVGQINTRLHWANSIVLGHEMAHFQNANRFGLNEHYFADENTGEEISLLDAYVRVFLTGHVGGPATSSAESHFDSELWAEEEMLHAASGSNWQMAHTESWIRKASSPGGKSAFDASDFYLNRIYPTAYALLDYRVARDDGPPTGDISKFALHLHPDQPREETLRKLIGYGIAANILSPVFWQTINEGGKYVATGDIDYQVKYYETKVADVIWDIPQYMNIGGYSLAPTLYVKPAGIDHYLGMSDILLTASYETAIMGDVIPEVRVTAQGKWNELSFDLGVTLGENGHFIEAGTEFSMSDSISLTTGLAITHGDTLRAKRTVPKGESLTWAGVKVYF